jgi:uncharacterized membrane protein
VREYFTGGNTLVRVGVVILFFGVAFWLRYVAEHSHVPIQLRLSAVALGGVALIALGWGLRRRRTGYALAIQGGGVGILYLTTFAALRLYSLLPTSGAFLLLILLAAFSAGLAVLQDSQAFALLAITGGFLAPILASTGEGSHVALFSYYAVLNASILAMAWTKSWRPLNFVGFAFTFVIATAWGALRYRPELFASTEPFLVLFFLFYFALAILFSTRQPPELKGYVDGTLVFGTPIATFGYQTGLLHDRPLALAASALLLAAFYFLTAWVLRRRQQPSQRLLIEAFTALGWVFVTVAVPLGFDDRRSAATWALEGAALVWIGCRQNRAFSRAFGAFLLLGGGILFLAHVGLPYGSLPILNGAFIAGVLVAASSVFAADVLQRSADRLRPYEREVPAALFLWGLCWWVYTGLIEVDRHAVDPYGRPIALVFLSATAILSSELARRTPLRIARWPALALLPVMVLFVGPIVELHQHPFAEGGWWAWPLAFASFYFVCRRHEGPPDTLISRLLHVGSAWLLVLLLTWELAWRMDQVFSGRGSWQAIGWALVPLVALFALPRLTTRNVPQWPAWPFRVHAHPYVVVAGVGIAGYLALWSLVVSGSLPADADPFPYVPVLNPLDLTQVLVLLVLLRYWLFCRARDTTRDTARDTIRDTTFRAGTAVDQGMASALAALCFIWLNAALLRAVHQWAGIPFDMDSMLHSTLVQTSLSIFWTVLALTTMLIATRRASRPVWLVGAGLLAVVIAKLFLIDLSRVGTVERIVSFVGVGVLTLVIGYFSPLPPNAQTARAD